MKISLFWRVLPVHIIIAAVYIVPFVQRHQVAAQTAQSGVAAEKSLQAPVTAASEAVIEGMPVRILIPSHAIDITIVPGEYDSSQKTWSVAKSSANYAPNTSKLNTKQGNPLIYGHWTRQVLGPTKSLVAGDIAYIYTNNNHIFKYTFTGNAIVKPTDVQIFGELKEKPGLVLMTCEGNWAQNRRMMYFDLVEAK